MRTHEETKKEIERTILNRLKRIKRKTRRKEK